MFLARIVFIVLPGLRGQRAFSALQNLLRDTQEAS